MLPLLVSALAAWLMGVLMGLNADYQAIYQRYLTQTVEHDVTWWADTIEDYRRTTGTYPASLVTIQSRNDYAATRSWNNTWLGYAVTNANGLNDGIWQYQRATVFEALPKDYALVKLGVSAAATQLLTENRCGTNSFTLDSSAWCARNDIRWWKGETRDTYVQLVTDQRLGQQTLVAKILNYYSTTKVLPGVGGTLPSEVFTLPTMVNPSMTATTCSGTNTINDINSTNIKFNNNGLPYRIPLDCQDLFSLTGKPTQYQAISPTRFAVQQDTGLLRSNGTPIFITTFVDIPI